MNYRIMLAPALAVLLTACTPGQPEQTSPEAAASPQGAPPTAAPAQFSADDAAPQTVGGIYIDKGACPGEGCYLKGKIKAYEAADLFDKAGPNAAVTGKIAKGDWVEILDTEDHVAPRRGVVREGRKNFATGDVVYLLGSEGEGCYHVFSKGKRGGWCDPEASDPETNEVIDWQEAPEALTRLAGLWVKVKRGDGSSGWINKDGIRNFGCTGYQDRDADCPPLPQ